MSTFTVDNIKISIILSFIAALLTYGFLRFIASPIIYKIVTKKNTKLLHLTRCNQICMKVKKIRNEQYFISDINAILDYAQHKKINVMRTKTHKVLVLNFLYEYTKYTRREISDIVNAMKINEKIKVKTTFGEADIIYKGKKINNCNRYNKNIKKIIKRIFEEKYIYDIYIYVNKSIK